MQFPPTNWTLLAQATINGDNDGRRALDDLCATYHRPIRIFIRAKGFSETEAQDLTQDFFLHWLRSNSWKRADRARGRFRSFLLASVSHMLAHHESKRRAAKRGGGNTAQSLDEMHDDGQEVADETHVESVEFDREWASALVSNALRVIEAEFAGRGREDAFAVLRRFLPSSGELISLDEAAQITGMNVGAVKAAVHRLRERFREVLRSSVAATVTAPHEVDEELQYLRSLMAKPAARIPATETGNKT
jgi:RNA polymerase sigma-70 factor (ECF subfamily)